MKVKIATTVARKRSIDVLNFAITTSSYFIFVSHASTHEEECAFGKSMCLPIWIFNWTCSYLRPHWLDARLTKRWSGKAWEVIKDETGKDGWSQFYPTQACPFTFLTTVMWSCSSQQAECDVITTLTRAMSVWRVLARGTRFILSTSQKVLPALGAQQ